MYSWCKQNLAKLNKEKIIKETVGPSNHYGSFVFNCTSLGAALISLNITSTKVGYQGFFCEVLNFAEMEPAVSESSISHNTCCNFEPSRSIKLEICKRITSPCVL